MIAFQLRLKRFHTLALNLNYIPDSHSLLRPPPRVRLKVSTVDSPLEESWGTPRVEAAPPPRHPPASAARLSAAPLLIQADFSSLLLVELHAWCAVLRASPARGPLLLGCFEMDWRVAGQANCGYSTWEDDFSTLQPLVARHLFEGVYSPPWTRKTGIWSTPSRSRTDSIDSGCVFSTKRWTQSGIMCGLCSSSSR